jgi:hypothetical protein
VREGDLAGVHVDKDVTGPGHGWIIHNRPILAKVALELFGLRLILDGCFKKLHVERESFSFNPLRLAQDGPLSRAYFAHPAGVES